MGPLVVVLLVLAVVVNPEFREHAKPYTETVLAPVYERLTRLRVGEIARALEAEESAGRPIPSSADLPAFLNENYHRANAVSDPWGTTYFITRDTWSIRVASAGRDGIPHTSDDILSPPIISDRR